MRADPVVLYHELTAILFLFLWQNYLLVLTQNDRNHDEQSSALPFNITLS